MSFPIMSREDLVKALMMRGIKTMFIDVHAVDVAANCYYHSIKNDVIAGFYTFEIFIDAHETLEKKGALYSIGEVRLTATETFHRAANKMRHDVEEKIRDGIVA